MSGLKESKIYNFRILGFYNNWIISLRDLRYWHIKGFRILEHNRGSGRYEKFVVLLYTDLTKNVFGAKWCMLKVKYQKLVVL